MTLPVIHLLARSDADTAALIRKIVRERTVTVDEWRALRTMLTHSRSIDYAHSTAVEFVERAKKALYVFPASASRDALMFLPDYVLSRDR
jgi:octaprenyl-diphosphate synthase